MIHVVSMQSSFRQKVKAAFPQLEVVWPEWDQAVSGQKDDRTGYKAVDMDVRYTCIYIFISRYIVYIDIYISNIDIQVYCIYAISTSMCLYEGSIGAKDMLLAGLCHVLVAPNGGSTYTYTPSAMYHAIALRDAPKKANCSDLHLG